VLADLRVQRASCRTRCMPERISIFGLAADLCESMARREAAAPWDGGYTVSSGDQSAMR
jgi:hypothetical protein